MLEYKELQTKRSIAHVVALESKVAQQAFSYHWAISRWQNWMLVFPQRHWTSIYKRIAAFQLETFELLAQNVLRHSAQHKGTRRNGGRFDVEKAESKVFDGPNKNMPPRKKPNIPLLLVSTHLTLPVDR